MLSSRTLLSYSFDGLDCIIDTAGAGTVDTNMCLRPRSTLQHTFTSKERKLSSPTSSHHQDIGNQIYRTSIRAQEYQHHIYKASHLEARTANGIIVSTARGRVTDPSMSVVYLSPFTTARYDDSVSY